jgi:hypothetical protein
MMLSRNNAKQKRKMRNGTQLMTSQNMVSRAFILTYSVIRRAQQAFYKQHKEDQEIMQWYKAKTLKNDKIYFNQKNCTNNNEH